MLFYVIFIFNACNTVSTVYPRLSSCRLSAAPYSCSATTVEMVDRLLPLQQSRLLLAAALAAFAEQAKSATVCRWISEEVFWGATWLHHRRLCFSAFDIDSLAALFYTQLASTRSYAIRTHVKYMFNFFIIQTSIHVFIHVFLLFWRAFRGNHEQTFGRSVFSSLVHFVLKPWFRLGWQAEKHFVLPIWISIDNKSWTCSSAKEE